jgi:hypothetical protein
VDTVRHVPNVSLAALPPITPGTRLVHFGFHKSGTTAIQEAFVDARDRLATSGVAYPKTGGQRHHGKSALGLAGMHYGWRSTGVSYEEAFWTDLLTEVEGYGDRTVVISSEHLAQVGPGTIRRIASDLGPRPVHAVATVRPLERILPSSWQQYVKGGLALPYIAWLEKVLADPPDPGVTPNFWRRHSHGDVISRWAELLGPENVTLVVLDETDRTILFRSFEALLSLPPDTLLATQRRDDNRSMTAAEAELVQRVAQAVRRLGVDWDFFFTVIRSGVAQRMARERLPAADEARLTTPKWALERAAELGERAAVKIEASGVTVVGDLHSLGRYTGTPGEDHQAPPEWVPVDAAVEAVLGGIENYERYAREVTTKMKRRPDAGTEPPEMRPPAMLHGRPVSDITSRELIATLRDRLMAKLRRTFRPIDR